MNNTTTTWSPMVSGPEDDFANFLEFGDLQLNFPGFDDGVQDEGNAQQEPVGGMDTNMGDAVEMMVMKGGEMPPEIDPILMSMQTSMGEMQDIHSSAESLMDLNMQAQLYNQQQQQYHQPRQAQGHYQRQGIVPPTPNSVEMQGAHPHSYAHVDAQTRAMYEHYARKQQDHMIFTPLVSPAVTPHDSQLRMPEYAVPGEYFSPLTSPALEAQTNVSQRSVYSTLRGSDTSDTASPVDINLDQNINMGPTSGSVIRKSKRKSISTTKPTGRAVRQSPAMKPQKRKQPSKNVITPKEITEIIKDARKTNPAGRLQANGKLPGPYRQDSSETESISPEPLSDILMPPPATPRPSSVGRSPYLKPQKSGSQAVAPPPTGNAPATPASLMKIQKNNPKTVNGRRDLEERSIRAEAEMEQIMQDISLPEPASKPTLSAINTSSLENDDQATPVLSAKRAPPSALTPVSGAVLPSPGLGAMASPGGSVSSKRSEIKSAGRSSKKRNNTNSSQVSPALRPRISPSIKPLLPEGTTINAETSALLLASKSNYQNILEGTHLPGVSYPEALSTNLTSKRTSHKIAEQGRRNRINNALQEIASLLPLSTPQMNGMSDGGGKDVSNAAANMMNGTAAQQSNSKASTVEMAIEYIKSLQSELRDVRGKLEVAERKLTNNGNLPGSTNVDATSTEEMKS